MAEIKKIYEDAERTTQILPETNERAVYDDNGTPLNSKLGAIVDLVNQKQMEVGAVPIDLEPTIGNTTHVVSSDGVKRAIDGASLKELTQVYYEKYYTGNNYNPGPTYWYRGSGAHIAVPISDLGGNGSVIALTTDPYGYVCFVTSYTPPISESGIPFAHASTVTNDDGTSSMSGRIAITKDKGTWYLTIPDNASHLIVGTKDAQGTAANFLLYKVSVEKVTDKVSEIDTRVFDLEAHSFVYDINEEISLADYTQANYNMTESRWYSVGKHKTIPISDLGGAGTTIALSTTDPNNTYCAFFYNYTTPSSASSPVYFVKHPNVVKHNGIFETYYYRIGLFSDADYNYITIPSDAVYFIINTVDGDGVDAGVKLYTTTEKKLDSAVDGLIKEVYGQVDGRTYDGEKISLKKPQVVITKMCKTPRCQDIWYQDGYFFNCELITNKRFELYHYENNALSLKAYWGLQETVGATFVSLSEGVHANSMQRTNIFYDPSDTFPIFTVGGNMGSESGKMYVMRLYKENETWQLTKLYDVQGEHWGIFALEDGTIAEMVDDEIHIFSKKITANNTGTIYVTDSDIVKTYTHTFPDVTMPQGMVNFRNQIFLLEGDSHSHIPGTHILTEPGHLMVYDFIYEKCVNDIYLIPLGIVIEPEGIDIDQGVMYIAENGENNNGYLWKLEFD